mgnify:CR=1 FL=1
MGNPAGIHSNVAKRLVNAARREYLASGDRVTNQLKAFRDGKKVMVTIANPNKEERNKAFIRVNASTIWKNKENFGYAQA